MFTMGYKFKAVDRRGLNRCGREDPYHITDVASEYDITERIMFGHRAIHADWSSEDRTWTVSIRNNAGDVLTITTRFLLNCSGYYNYEQGFSPTFEGSDEFAGTIVHPQHWPEDLEYSGKRVVVIGSGATAVTLMPSMAKTAEHVTMLQRSPTYIASIPAADPLAEKLRGHVSDDTTYKLVRFKSSLCGPIDVHDRPQGSQLHAQATSQSSDGGPARRLRLRHPPDSHLQTRGSASVRVPRW